MVRAVCFLEWLQWLQRSPHSQFLDVVWCSEVVVVVVAVAAAVVVAVVVVVVVVLMYLKLLKL